MAENPLFYKTIVPLNRERHRAFKLKADAVRFAFAAQAHVIPAVIDEFVSGGRHLPIVFLPGSALPSAVFLLGLRPGENRFVTPDGAWTGEYIPAFVRRYPFIIGEVPNADPVVCIDEDYDGFDAQSGEALFLDSGDDAPVLKNGIQFINEYLLAANRTETFIAAIQRLGLFRTVTIDVRAVGQESRTLHGMMTIDVEKLDKLADADFLGLRNAGHLPMIYAHLNSLAGIDRLGPAVTATTPAPVDAADGASASKKTARNGLQ